MVSGKDYNSNMMETNEAIGNRKGIKVKGIEECESLFSSFKVKGKYESLKVVNVLHVEPSTSVLPEKRDKEALIITCEEENSYVVSSVGKTNEKACIESSEACGVEDTQIATCVGFERSGLMHVGGYPGGPVSFDKACSLVNNTRPKLKKIKKLKK